MTIFQGFIISLFFALSSSVIAGELNIGHFSKGDLTNWKNKEFSGITQYTLIKQNNKQVLQAKSNATASGLYKEIRVDLKKTPYLNWSWRVENTLGALNEQSKNGDDYPARIYVVVSGGLVFWNTRAINYVWSSNSQKGAVWKNAFAGSNAMMIALRSKNDNVKQWYTEKRNILHDLKQQFGEDIFYIDAVAIMTDTDNSNSQTTAFYGDIYFSEQ